jgi:protein O-GlcNAc transferase
MVRKRRKQKKSSATKNRSINRSLLADNYALNVDNAFHTALCHHQNGQLNKAEQFYKKILKADPNHADALHLLGLIARRTGRHDTALDLMHKAVRIRPQNAVYYFNMGNTLKDHGSLDEAMSCYRKALDIRPEYAEAYNNMGVVLKDQGKSHEAIRCYRKAVALKPDDPLMHNNMGTALRDQGELNEALLCYQKALHLKPDFTEAHSNMGNALKERGELDKAISCYQKALQLKPDYAQAHYNLGNAFIDQGRLSEGIACYQKALQIEPNSAEVHNNLGNALKCMGELDKAMSCYQKALQLKPAFAEAFSNMGNVLTDQGQLVEAISCHQRALQIEPEWAQAYNDMGNALKDQGKSDEAIICYTRALEIEPECGEACNNLVDQLQQTCAWKRLEGVIPRLDQLTQQAMHNGTRIDETPSMSITREAAPSRNFAVAQSLASEIARRMSSLNIPFPFDDRRSGKPKITVGYLSSDFRNHPVAHLMLGLFGLHNRDEFEIFSYSHGNDDGSLYRERIRRESDKFVDLHNASYDDAAKCIYNDQVDILVDLMGHTGGSRLGICALRPAPIQVSYLGFPGTTGAGFFDYLIADRIVAPEEHAPYYSENLVYLPHCYQVNDHTQPVSNKDMENKDFGLPEGGFVFCSFNNTFKIEPVMFDIWMNILREVPESVLWLLQGNETAENNLRQEAEARGVKPERLIFAKRLPKHEHLARHGFADLALDTRIYNGHTTTSDALWVGVPVITLRGSHFASRVASSILTAIGLSELITHTLEEYEALAVGLACDPGELRGIQEKLLSNRLTEPLFDTPRFARNLEKAYREMWKSFLMGERPRHIDVGES